jgi:glutaconyl-CoA/methylmalonyl-CoA decarboxylase subunit gamma
MRRYSLEVGGKQFVLEVQEVTANRFQVFVDDQTFDVRLKSDEDLAESTITPEIVPSRGNNQAHVDPMVRPVAGSAGPTTAPPKVPARPRPTTDAGVLGALTAPMPGKILSVEVAVGARVSRGQTLLILEAMKMKNAIKAPQDGVVMAIAVQPEQTVAFGDLLLQLGGE